MYPFTEIHFDIEYGGKEVKIRQLFYKGANLLFIIVCSVSLKQHLFAQ